MWHFVDPSPTPTYYLDGLRGLLNNECQNHKNVINYITFWSFLVSHLVISIKGYSNNTWHLSGNFLIPSAAPPPSPSCDVKYCPISFKNFFALIWTMNYFDKIVWSKAYLYYFKQEFKLPKPRKSEFKKRKNVTFFLNLFPIVCHVQFECPLMRIFQLKVWRSTRER